MSMARTLKIVAFLQIVFFGGMGLWAAVEMSFDYLMYIVGMLFFAAIALAIGFSWAPRGMMICAVAGAIAGCVEIAQIGFAQTTFFLYVFIGLCILLALFYQQANVRSHYARRVRRGSILLVDDDKTLLTLLKANFTKEGFLVFLAETGEKGLALAKRYHPDLILLDVILPGVKGRTVCSLLQEDPRTKGIPVIFLTAKDSPDDVQAEMAAGAIAHITKPVNFRNLLDEVNKILK